ncbi:hypothetical protein KAR91_66740 [Candidatus Pacearchaeota archaeon]|nr:hypothetical protein [Candidatus Pacearchaeota archaeon]
MTKRYRAPKARDGQLKLQWGQLPDECEPELCGAWAGGATRTDLHLLFNMICGERNRYMHCEQMPSLVDELISRGYDITTLKFSIEKLNGKANEKRNSTKNG